MNEKQRFSVNLKSAKNEILHVKDRVKLVANAIDKGQHAFVILEDCITQDLHAYVRYGRYSEILTYSNGVYPVVLDEKLIGFVIYTTEFQDEEPEANFLGEKLESITYPHGEKNFSIKKFFSGEYS